MFSRKGHTQQDLQDMMEAANARQVCAFGHVGGGGSSVQLGAHWLHTSGYCGA